MAKKTRTELSTLAVNTNLPDNTSEQITPTTERAQLTEERDSVINYKDDLGGSSNAGKFLTVGADGESLTIVDEPSGVPDWVTFASAINNLMMLKSGSSSAQIQFFDADGTTLGAKIIWNETSSSVFITNSQTNETIQLVGGDILLQTSGNTRAIITSGGSLLVKTNATSGISIGDIGLDNGALRGGIIRARNAADNAYKALIYLDQNDAVQVGTAATGLTISSGGNATFNGTLDVGSFTISGSGIIADAAMTLQVSGGSVNALALAASTGLATFSSSIILNNNEGIFWEATSGANEGIASNGSDLLFYTAGVNRLTITSGGETTISAINNSDTLTIKNTGTYGGTIAFTQGASTNIGYVGSLRAFEGNATGDNGIGMFSRDRISFYTDSSTPDVTISSGGIALFGRAGVPISASGTRIDPTGESYNSITNSMYTLHIYDVTNGIYRFYVSGAGQINATATSINGISDISLKENIKTLETGLDEVIKLKPKRFDWKNGDGKNIAGFVAQEVEEILPDLVSEINYNSTEKKKAIKMGDMIPTLVNAIQEQQTIIQDLKARIEKLEL